MFAIKTLKTRTKYPLLTIVVVIGAIFFQKIFSYYRPGVTVDGSNKRILSLEELSTYDGVRKERLYLAIIGNVFDVTEGSKHYKKGSPYNYFIGKDGSKALVTGSFNDESNDKDHVLDLPCKELLTILHWRQTFKQKYIFVGFLNGKYYDENGSDTLYMSELKQKIKYCKIKKEEAKEQEKLYPPCNMAWSEKDGASVWCTKSSGGIIRDWVGVPRQMYTPGEEKPQCVCVNVGSEDIHTLKEYHGCPKASIQCTIFNT